MVKVASPLELRNPKKTLKSRSWTSQDDVILVSGAHPESRRTPEKGVFLCLIDLFMGSNVVEGKTVFSFLVNNSYFLID